MSTGLRTGTRKGGSAHRTDAGTDLYPTGSWRDHPPTVTPPDLDRAAAVIPDVPLDESQSSLLRYSANQDLLHLRELVKGTREICRECIPGSNEWAISGAHTASGKPLLSNDMHLDHEFRTHGMRST